MPDQSPLPRPRIPLPRVPDPSLNEVYGEIMACRTDVANLRDNIIDLKEHVNDEIDLLNQRIDGKLDNDQLLTSFGSRLLNNAYFRWGLGAIVVTTILPLLGVELFHFYQTVYRLF